MNTYIAIKDQGTATVHADTLAAAWAQVPDADFVEQLDMTPQRPVILGAWQGYDSLESAR